MIEKLRILFIDDNADFDTHPKTKEPQFVDTDLSDLFELDVITNIVDLKYYLDGFTALSNRTPEFIGRYRLVPEMLVFDYSLQQCGLDRPVPGSAIVARMEQATNASGAAVFPSAEPSEDVAWDEDKDPMGCYVGVSLTHAFAAHPCVSVPTTARLNPNSMSSDVKFFEWLHGSRFSFDEISFSDRSRLLIDWPKLTSQAVRAFRTQFNSLVAGGFVVPVLDELLTLANEKALIDLGSDAVRRLPLSFRSRFGPRAIALGSIFADDLFNGGVKPENIALWAEELIETAYAAKIDQIRLGTRRAEKYFAWGSSPESVARYAFGHAIVTLATAAAGRPDDDSWTQLERTCEMTVEKAAAAVMANRKATLPSSSPVVKDHMLEKPDGGSRLSVLFLCVMLEHREWMQYRQFKPLSHSMSEWFVGIENLAALPYVPEQELLTEWSHDEDDEKASDRINKLIVAGVYSRVTIDGIRYLRKLEDAHLDLELFYRYLDPLPDRLLPHRDLTESDGVMKVKPNYTKLNHPLAVLHLAFDDIVRGRPFQRFDSLLERTTISERAHFNCATDEPGVSDCHTATVTRVKRSERRPDCVCATFNILGKDVDVDGLSGAPDKTANAQDRSLIRDKLRSQFSQPLRFEDSDGLRPGEGKLLRAYAAGLGFTDGLPPWLENCP